MNSLIGLTPDLLGKDTSIDNILIKLRHFQIHEINQQRPVFGEYHHLFPIIKNYEDKFYKYMRMNKSTFDYILSHVEKMTSKNWCNLHQQPILPEERLVVTIRFLATGASYSNLAFTFRMGESTVCTIIKQNMEIIWNVFNVVHMPVPSVNDFQRIAKDFYFKWNFPHCVGAIDGRHVRIKKPAKSGSKYYNFKKFFSIVLQAVVDANYKFIVIDVGGYGSQHDATTFRASTLYSALQEEIIKLPNDDAIPQSEIILPYFFIGDGAYPLMNYLMKPYPGKDLPADKELFNKRLSRARMVVECAFGIVSQKWNIFLQTIQQTPETAEMIVKTTCILHNIIIDLEVLDNNELKSCRQTEETREPFVEIENNAHDESQHGADNNYGKEIREELKKYLLHNPLP